MNARGFLVLSVLLVTAGLLIRSYYTKAFRTNLIHTIEHNLDREFSVADAEATQLLKDNLDVSAPAWDLAKHFFIRVDSGQIVAWNRTYFVPDLAIVSVDDTITFLPSSRGDFLVKKWSAGNGSDLFCVLKLTDRFPIINNFLSPQWEQSIFPVKDLQLSGPSDAKGDEVTHRGKVLFHLLPQKADVHESLLSFGLLLSALFCLGIVLWMTLPVVAHKWNYDLAFLMLFAALLGIRWGMIGLGFPAYFLPMDLFDPKKFASSSLNASLGDLCFNAAALLTAVVYLFVHFTKFALVRWTLQKTENQRFAAGVVCLLACFFAWAFPYDFIEAIYHNSTIVLDSIQSLSFEFIRLSALFAVLLGCASSFLFLHLLLMLANHLLGRNNRVFFTGLLVAAAVFAFQFYLTERNLWMVLLLALFYFLVIRISRISRGAFRMSFRIFIYLIFSLSVISFQNAWAVRVFFMERQTKDQFRFGKDFLIERDVLGEYLLDEARQRIQADQFIQTRMSSLFLSKTAVVDKIRRIYLNNYFDRYEIIIRTRLEGGDVGESITTPLDSSIVPGRQKFLPTGYRGISYLNASEGTTVKRYRMTIPIYHQRPVGSVELDLALKRVIPENVYPELLVDNRFNQIYRNRDFSYAVFTKGKLVNSFGAFNYQRDFRDSLRNAPDLIETGLSSGLYYHVGIEDQEGSIAIVSATIYSWFYLVTNFSFWFVLGLVLLFAGQGLLGLSSYVRGVPFNYTARIQLLVFLAFLLPVLAVSITTLTLIGRSNEDAIKKDFIERSATIGQRIAGWINSDSVRVRNETSLEGWIEENAQSSKTDISVYSPEGRLLATSQPSLFEDQLVSRMINREAWRKIALQHELEAVTNEEIGKLQYSCAYSAVLSPETGELMAIVGLPFFESATFLQKSQSLIFSNILIVFVVVFMMFSFLSSWASNSLTFPIRFITKTLGQTTLNGQNKPLQWNSSDEIGTLVKEYNRMVENLEDSKRALAQSEKEIAWREMAKQVAHEIKNPLTPMKLTLQQLENALLSGELSMEKAKKSVEVLLKQVEILNSISISFSTFANMPAPSPQVVDLWQLLSGSVTLFDAADEGSVRLLPVVRPLKVSVDPISFSRVVSNVIINALQSKREGQEDFGVSIDLSEKPNYAVIAVRDNGKGMSREVQEKIFEPHFTTKKSGSGLGLAMAKQIVTQAGGRIGFESVLNQGTTFLIELPLLSDDSKNIVLPLKSR